MRDQSLERQRPALYKLAGGRQVVAGPLGGDAQAGLFHESGRKGELQRLGIEAGQHDLAAAFDPRDQGIEQRAISRRVIDRPVVPTRIVIGRQNRVARGAALPGRIDFPDRWGRAAGSQRETGQQAAQHTVAHDQIGQGLVQTGQRMAGRRGQRQKRAFGTVAGVDARDAACIGDQSAGGPPEQAFDLAIAIRAGDEHMLTRAKAAFGSGFDDLARAFVSGHQRIAHAGKRRHLTRPEQFLGPGGDTRVGNLDNQVRRTGRGKRDIAKT